MENLFANIPATMPLELVETILKQGSLRVERIVSQGHASPEGFWYDQEQHELVFLLQGAARLQLDDAVRELKVGDYVNIPAHCRHRVAWTTPDEPTVWLAIFYG
ncbi:MAG: phosphoribosylaminoimidazole carboxylase [Pirellula sp.]|nr:phosphoribosylaminoimidazole carboxylase [Pirellula sp.]